MNYIELSVNIMLTSALTCGLLFLILRWLFGKIFSGLSSFTSLGAKVAGEKSGFNRASKVVMEDAAEGILGSGQLGGIKMLASQFGFDLDSMIEEHGAVETLSGITQLLGILGINPTDLITKGLAGIGKNLLSGQKQSSSSELGL